MEIEDMFESWIETFRLYRCERFPLRIFALVAVVLTLAAFVEGIPHDWFEVLLSWMASVLLLLQFRIWDDLGDRNHDGVDLLHAGLGAGHDILLGVGIGTS